MINKTPAHPGIVVAIGGKEYVMPAMLFKTRKRIKAAEQAVAAGATDFDADDLAIEVLLETLQRNYPELTVEQLVEAATQEELSDAYHRLDIEEARRMAELGKRKLAALRELMAADSSTLTTLSHPSSASSEAAGNSGSASSTS